jgi:hypothetical protein
VPTTESPEGDLTHHDRRRHVHPDHEIRSAGQERADAAELPFGAPRRPGDEAGDIAAEGLPRDPVRAVVQAIDLDMQTERTWAIIAAMVVFPEPEVPATRTRRGTVGRSSVNANRATRPKPCGGATGTTTTTDGHLLERPGSGPRTPLANNLRVAFVDHITPLWRGGAGRASRRPGTRSQATEPAICHPTGHGSEVSSPLNHWSHHHWPGYFSARRRHETATGPRHSELGTRGSAPPVGLNARRAGIVGCGQDAAARRQERMAAERQFPTDR